MEKVLYLIGDGSGLDDPGRRGDLVRRLIATGAHGVQVNVADAEVAPATSLRISTSTAPTEAMVSVWVDSAIDHLRAPFDDVVVEAVAHAPDVVGKKSRAPTPEIPPISSRVAAYLVTESVPLVDDQRVDAGERTRGFAQLAFIQRPDSQPVNEWLDLWLNSHTQIALELQDTFAYVQNVVTRILTPGATPWHAIVEECFPATAMTDPCAFFDAIGDDNLLVRRQRKMFESVQRFIDLSRIDVIPTSRYRFEDATNESGGRAAGARSPRTMNRG